MRRTYIIILTILTIAAAVWILAPAPTIDVEDVQRPPTDRIIPICWDDTCADVPGAMVLVNQMRSVCLSKSVEVYAESWPSRVALSARCRMGDSAVWGSR